MARRKSGKKTTKVRDLPVRKGSGVKGKAGALSDAIKNIGDALATMARKG
jgi:hypothetical protein